MKKNVVLLFACALVASASRADQASLLPKTPDGCEFIREAIAKLPSAGGTVKIPAGLFECRASIFIKKSGVRLIGAGRDKTTLKLANFAHAPVLVIGDSIVEQNSTGDWVTPTRVNDVVVSDLTVDGNLANQDPKNECGNGICDGDVTNIRNNAITIRGGSRIKVLRVTAHSAISGGLVTEKYCDNLEITDFTSYGNYFDGFAGYQTHSSVFKNLNLSRNRGAGISIDIDFSKNVFKTALLASNGDVGIFARDTNDVVFSDLTITKSGSHGVFLAEAEHPDSCANRNEFKNLKLDSSNGVGFFLASPCAGNRITGNSVIQANKEGCYFVNDPIKAPLNTDPTVVCKD